MSAVYNSLDERTAEKISECWPTDADTRNSETILGYFAASLTSKILCEQMGDIIQPCVGRFGYLSLYPAKEFRCFSDLPCGVMENLQIDDPYR